MDSYTSWQELLDEEPGSTQRALSQDDGAAKVPVEGAALQPPSGFTLSPELQALQEEKERLERHLKSLTGHGDPDPEAARQAKMYPPVAAAERRAAERQRRRRQEERRLKTQKIQRAQQNKEQTRSERACDPARAREDRKAEAASPCRSPAAAAKRERYSAEQRKPRQEAGARASREPEHRTHGALIAKRAAGHKEGGARRPPVRSAPPVLPHDAPEVLVRSVRRCDGAGSARDPEVRPCAARPECLRDRTQPERFTESAERQSIQERPQPERPATPRRTIEDRLEEGALRTGPRRPLKQEEPLARIQIQRARGQEERSLRAPLQIPGAREETPGRTRSQRMHEQDAERLSAHPQPPHRESPAREMRRLQAMASAQQARRRVKQELEEHLERRSRRLREEDV